MTSVEFWARINADGTLTVPPEIVARLEPEQPLRVILLTSQGGDDREWATVTAEQFPQGYADTDAIYDELPAG